LRFLFFAALMAGVFARACAAFSLDSSTLRAKAHYAALGLSPGAGEEEVRAAYRHLVKLYHPDKNTSPDAEARYRQIRAAYEALKGSTVFPNLNPDPKPVWQTPPSWEHAPSSHSSPFSSRSSASSQPSAGGQGWRFVIDDDRELLFESLHESKGCAGSTLLWFSIGVILIFLSLLLFGVSSIFPR
jgi:hypothetical protein